MMQEEKKQLPMAARFQSEKSTVKEKWLDKGFI
jgi:hypothetical protein